MHITLHLTTGCNMICQYCYSKPKERNDMTPEVAKQCVDFIAEKYPINTGIIFFGGEPLLKKELIKYIIELCEAKKTNAYFHYKVTTNGLLIDSDFMTYADDNKLQVSISIDGNESAHDTFRRLPNEEPTFNLLQDKIDLLLKHQPYSKCLMTVSPENLIHYSDSFQYLIERGFKYLIVSLNYAGNWTEQHIKQLKKEYKKIAYLYKKYTEQERKFYFSPFEMKFASHIRQSNLECYQCHLAKRQISIAFDGTIYPCVQFVQDGISNKSYGIGDVWSGIDNTRQELMYKQSKEQNDICLSCDYNDRCNNKCSCLNWQLSRDLCTISPVVCETEQILIPIVDKLGEQLYKKKSPMFIQKHYNAVYPILSMLEDLHSH